MKTIGIDLGYGAVKGVGEGRSVHFPSLVKEKTSETTFFLREATVGEADADLAYSMLLDGKIYQFGRAAVSSKETRRISRGELLDFDEKLLVFALANLIPYSQPQKVVVGIPFHYLVPREKARQIAQSLKGKRWEVWLLNEATGEKIPRVIEIAEAVETRQGLAALWDEFIHEISPLGVKGDFYALSKQTTVVVDIGTGTTELVVVSKNRVLHDHCRSIRAGVYDVVYSLRTWLLKEGYGEVSPYAIEEEVIKKGARLLGSGEISVAEKVEEAKNALWQKIEAELFSLIGELDDDGLFTHRRVLFTGGGSYFLDGNIKRFAEQFKGEVRPAVRRLFANAHGARKAALWHILRGRAQETSRDQVREA